MHHVPDLLDLDDHFLEKTPESVAPKGIKWHQMAWAFDPVQTHKALPNERTQHGKHMGSSWGFSRGFEWV